MYVPTAIEKLAIQARLNFMLGSKLYDSLFLGFDLASVNNRKTATVFARSEYNANQIATNYRLHVAIAIESIIKLPIKNVIVFPVQ